eukprot:tig00020555_g10961.t1
MFMSRSGSRTTSWGSSGRWGLPCNIRLLDPPLHEFIPKSEEEIAELAPKLGLAVRELREMRDGLEESNPMLGHRGCRLGIVHPEITTMQVQAILEAAIEVSKEGVEVHPEIMVLLIDATAAAVFKAAGTANQVTVGTMVRINQSFVFSSGHKHRL